MDQPANLFKKLYYSLLRNFLLEKHFMFVGDEVFHDFH